MKTPVFILLCATVAGTGSASAALLAYEGFNYGSPGADLVGQNGGTGFSGPWVAGGFNASISNNFDRNSLSIPASGLSTSGGSVLAGVRNDAISGVSRTLTTSLGSVGTTAYVSAVLQPAGVIGAGLYSGFFGLTLESPTEPEIFVGKPGSGTNNYAIEERGGSNQRVTTTAAVVGQPMLLVLKAEFKAGADTFTLYLNPTPGAPEPASGFVLNATVGSVSALTLYSTGAFSTDELRVGQTFADVTPVPEPSLAALVWLGMMGAFMRRRG